MSVIVEFSIFPMDKGESLSPYVARAFNLIQESGLSYELMERSDGFGRSMLSGASKRLQPDKPGAKGRLPQRTSRPPEKQSRVGQRKIKITACKRSQLNFGYAIYFRFA
jgi:hypothetical protein